MHRICNPKQSKDPSECRNFLHPATVESNSAGFVIRLFSQSESLAEDSDDAAHEWNYPPDSRKEKKFGDMGADTIVFCYLLEFLQIDRVPGTDPGRRLFIRMMVITDILFP